MQDVLLLNADYAPVQILAWERAVCLLLARKARAVAHYTDRTIRSPGFEMAWPAVVSLVQYVRVRASPKLSRRNVMARDAFTCQYCGDMPLARSNQSWRELTLDHVIPRARSREGTVVLPWNGRRVPVTSWENLVTACAPCNHRKADRSPAEAGMDLATRPRRPTPSDTLRIVLARTSVPDEWVDFLP